MELGFVIMIKIKNSQSPDKLIFGPFGKTIKEAFDKLKQKYGNLVPQLTIMVFQAIRYSNGKIVYFSEPRFIDEEYK